MRINIITDLKQIPVTRKKIRETLRNAAKKEKWQGDLNVAITNDMEISDINKRFLNKKGPTDVIAFSYGEDSDGLAGEIMVSAETAERVASTHNETPGKELLRYCVHGFLHLCGYNDLNLSDRKIMENRQEHLLPRQIKEDKN